MAAPHAEAFIAALHRLEEQNDAEGMVSLFADDAELIGPTDVEPSSRWRWRPGHDAPHQRGAAATAPDSAAIRARACRTCGWSSGSASLHSAASRR